MPVLLLAVASVLVVDQLSKRAIENRLSEKEVGWHRSIIGLKRVTAVRSGVQSRAHRWRLIGVWAVAIAGSLLYASSGGPLLQFGLGCAIGGATSNLLDRLWRGGIVDFVAVGFWPVFNLADVAIVVGVLLALCVAD